MCFVRRIEGLLAVPSLLRGRSQAIAKDPRDIIDVRVSIGASGAVRSAQKVAAEVDDPTVIGCVVKAARGLALAPPRTRHTLGDASGFALAR